MSKLKAITLAFVLLSSLFGNTATANLPPTLVIIDSAINSSLPEFKSSIVHEVCVISNDLMKMPWTEAKSKSCPNGTRFMEGPGAASMPLEYMVTNGFEHGSLMVSAAIQTDPNVKIIFIRIYGHGWPNAGGRTPTNQMDIALAYDWIISNQEKFNIQAIALSQGTSPKSAGPQETYCDPAVLLTPKILALNNLGVPTFMAVGNQRNRERIGWPACLPSVIPVAGLDVMGYIAIQNNWDIAKTILVAKGSYQGYLPNGKLANILGSSAANQAAATQYLRLRQAKPNLSSSAILELMKQTSTITSTPYAKNGYVLNIDAALKK